MNTVNIGGTLYWSWLTIFMCLLGLLTHLLLAWYETRRYAMKTHGAGFKAHPALCFWTWWFAEPVGPTVSVLTSIAFYVSLPELHAVPWLAPVIGPTLGLSPLGAFTVGLTGSYIGKKIVALSSKL